jgi:hypothetical protein
VKRLRLAVIPGWLTGALSLLGAAYVVTYPLARVIDKGTFWGWYVIALLFAVGFAVWTRRTRTYEVLERSETETERVWLVRMTAKNRRRRAGQRSPV